MGDEAAFMRAIREEPDERTHRLVYADWLQEQGQERRADALRHGVLKRFGVDFDSPGGALTLDPLEVNAAGEAAPTGHSARTHDDGWTIAGEVREDYFTWVNDFEAEHPEYGLVWGDFESLVFASSEQAYQHFHANHPPHAWDYGDI